MNLPKFNIGQNKQLDKEIIAEFFEVNDPVILESFPEIVEVGDVNEVVEMEYKEEISSIRYKIKELGASLYKLKEICEVLSVIMNEDWEGIDEVNIYVGVCPIAPHFLEDNSFLLPHYHELPILLNWSAHELTHFLYFKKFAKLFPNEKPETFESPHANWVLSETLAPVIDSDKRIKSITNTDSNLYPDWQKVKIEGRGLQEIFTAIYKESKTFDEFLVKAKEKYAELDKKYQLTQTLTN
jgi:hypothetical protein